MVGGAKGGGKLRRLVQIAAILDAQAELGEDSPVETDTVNDDRFFVVLNGRLASCRREEVHSATSQSEGTEVFEWERDHPCRGDFAVVGANGLRQRSGGAGADVGVVLISAG